MQKQNTLAASFSLQGKGLHSGLNIEVSFNPAPENHGYKIKRVDLPEQPVISLCGVIDRIFTRISADFSTV